MAGGGIAAVLLAAGESKRMGRSKALLPWHGTTLIEHQIFSLASTGISKIVTVLGNEARPINELLLKNWPWVRCVYNADYLQGRTTSIKVGLRALEPALSNIDEPTKVKAILVLNVDQPRSPTLIRRLIDAHTSSEEPYLITSPIYRGKLGHPPIFSTVLYPELQEISEDTLGLKEVFRKHQDDIREVEIDSQEVLLDLNTPEEYRAALEKSGHR